MWLFLLEMEDRYPGSWEFNALLLHIFKGAVSRSQIRKLPSSLKVLENYRHKVDSRLFATSLYVILAEACRQGQSQLVSYVLQYHSKLIDIDRVFRYRFKDCPVSISLSVTERVSKTVTMISILDDDDDVSVISRSNTLIHLAVENDHLDIVQMLIKAGAKVDIKNCCGHTPLMLGTRSFRTTKFLLSLGAEVNVQDKWGSTALLIAVDKGASPATISLLLENGANDKIRNRCGYSFLHKIYSRNTNVVEYSHVLEDKKISLACRRSGLLVCDNVPLCIASIEPSFFEDLDEKAASWSLDVQLSLKYLNPMLCLLNKGFHFPEEYRSVFHDALSFKAQHKLSIEYPSPLRAYQWRSEVTNVSELASLPTAELTYQNLIVAERVAGYGSFITLWLIIDTLWINYKYRKHLKATRSQQEFDMLQRGIDMLCYRMKEYGIEKRNAVIIQELVNFLKLSNPHPGMIEMASQLLSCIKLQLKMFEKAHGHHSVPVSSESRYRYAEFRSELVNMTQSGLYLLIELADSGFTIHGLMIDFIEEMPLIVSPYDEVYSLLSLAIHSARYLIRIMLECGGDKWIHTRVLRGDFPVSLILQPYVSGKRLSKDEIALADCLFEYGMHPDCVDSKGRLVLKLLPPNLKHHAPLESSSSVPPLSCVCARVIVAEKLRYWTGSLPSHVVGFVSLHDPKAHRRHMREIMDLP